jgi:hypothetical protein
VADQFDAEVLEELRSDGAHGNPGCGFAGACPFQDGACLIEAVLLHAGEVCVAGPRPGQGGVAGLVGEQFGIHRIRGHDLLPLGPFGVAHLDGDGTALGAAVADAAEDGDNVLFELHAGAASVAEPAARQGVCDVPAGDFHTGGDAFNNSHQSRTMGFTGSQPTQHNFLSCH